ncbi:RecQ family ATP-dependent DNA helicase [Pantanalinema rosaneae CENA516]|uniref:RecQ family ATP-dependent DNA helicase n=1 Tax=Pantanalinema rosaneae TaxID=1620701 RepID=UPI003D7013FA
MTTTIPPAWNQVQAALQRIWGYPSFRPPQGEIVQSLLAHRDSVTILPTGGGKSICFQLPAILQPGLTLVVSPLVALMENQVQELRDRAAGFRQSVALLHNELSTSDRKRILGLLEQRKLQLLYLSPETLFSPAVWQRLCQPNFRLNGLILDEAHCLVQWGDTFRPAYYRLGAVRSSLVPYQPANHRMAIAAFTATADPQAQQTIERVLQLEDPQIFRLNPYRSNLQLTVQVAWSPRQRRQRLLQLIQAHPAQAGLVYVRTRRDSEALVTWLQAQGWRTAAYHAGLSPDSRRQIEQAWLSDRLQFVVSTNAFGMGVNKPNVRWVAHFHAPLLLSEYVQEVGRAGRDGKPATALTLISETTGWLDPEDKHRRQFFLDHQQQQVQSAQQLMRQLPLEGEVTAVIKQFPQAAIAFALLHHAGCLDWIDPFHYRITERKSGRLGQSNATAATQMLDYLKTNRCRWQVLLAGFGFGTEAAQFRCGHCDNCR